MKKLIALIAAIALLCTGFVFAEAANDDLANAKSYLRMMYKNQPETTMTDYTVVGRVMIGSVEFPIEWTADSETVKIIPGEDGMVTIDVDEKNPEEVAYVLTATLKSGDAVETVSFNHVVPAALILEGLSYEEIVAAAYTLEDGLAMEEPQRLFGTVTKIDTPWSEDYQNITVTIQVGDLIDQPIMCYRLKGEGAKDLAVGDEITVEGIFKNYKGTIEFDAGCQLIGMGEIVSQQGILDAGYALEDGVAMTAPTALAGEIINIDTAWSDEYQNITVTMVCDGKTEQPIMCYRLKGEGAKDLAVGDEIAVAGTIKNYKGTIEFDAGCVLVPVAAVNDVRTVLNAYTLEDGLSITDSKSMTGVISAIDTAWSEDYQNITVTMIVAGLEDYPIMCYRLKGEGAKDLAIGDTISVSGIMKNYKGTIEFDAGCELTAVVKAEVAEEAAEEAAEEVAAEEATEEVAAEEAAEEATEEAAEEVAAEEATEEVAEEAAAEEATEEVAEEVAAEEATEEAIEEVAAEEATEEVAEEVAAEEVPAEEVPAAETLVVTAEVAANVRCGAGMQYAPIEWAEGNEVVTIVEKGDYWTKVELNNGVVGYIYNDLLK